MTNTELTRDYSKYYTLPETTSMMVEMAEIQEGYRILEPSAGAGAIVRAIRNAWSHDVEIHAVEIQQLVVHRHLFAADADITICGDFLKAPLEGAEYDRVIANPPFGNGTDLDKHWIKMWLSVARYGLIISIVPANFMLENLSKTYKGDFLESHPLENWGTNKDGSVTPIKLIKFRKR